MFYCKYISLSNVLIKYLELFKNYCHHLHFQSNSDNIKNEPTLRLLTITNIADDGKNDSIEEIINENKSEVDMVRDISPTTTTRSIPEPIFAKRITHSE